MRLSHSYYKICNVKIYLYLAKLATIFSCVSVHIFRMYTKGRETNKTFYAKLQKSKRQRRVCRQRFAVVRKEITIATSLRESISIYLPTTTTTDRNVSEWFYASFTVIFFYFMYISTDGPGCQFAY